MRLEVIIWAQLQRPSLWAWLELVCFRQLEFALQKIKVAQLASIIITFSIIAQFGAVEMGLSPLPNLHDAIHIDCFNPRLGQEAHPPHRPLDRRSPGSGSALASRKQIPLAIGLVMV